MWLKVGVDEKFVVAQNCEFVSKSAPARTQFLGALKFASLLLYIQYVTQICCGLPFKLMFPFHIFELLLK